MKKPKTTMIDVGSLGTVGAVTWEHGSGWTCKVSPNGMDRSVPDSWLVSGHGETEEEAHRACKNQLIRAAFN